MNNEILSRAENRNTSENARENKSAATVAKGLLFRFCRGNAERCHPHDTRGMVCSRRLYQLFRYFRGARWACLRSCRFFFDGSLARENALRGVRYRCIVKIISTAVSPDADDDEKDDDGMGYCETTSSRQQETTILLLRTFI